ncbi:hypothetical protein [Williamwhitmania taraxaci]|uniref:Uncharacterized protein n=1 Tax=Williamwhitmania taraxaci TaxID=1640674 RepID=A0A1G6IJN0_9BACT|nr:hypothetical protein [Williamwhitmania taraxaci]SDC06739.1 hypothetical protein SAMN05216323_101629 [Williamwhitmania taraxaci]
MQEEEIEQSRTVSGILRNAKRSIKGKIQTIVIEIIIIVFGVTISIWLQGRSQYKNQQQEVKEFLADIKTDITDNIRMMAKANASLSQVITDFSYIEKLSKKQYDSIARGPRGDTFLSEMMSAHIILRRSSDGNYEGFKSSGKIGYIENKKLKKLILSYYQQKIPSLLEVDKYYNASVSRITDYSIEEADKQEREFLFDPKLRAILSVTLNMAQSSKAAYELITKEAQKIIAEIEKEERR